MKKILRINLSNLTQSFEEPKKVYQILGGRAFIARFLLDEVKPTCDPLGRHNKLIFTPGLLGGSKVFSSGRISIGAKSPLTGGAKESNGGGVVGVKLGRLGYHAIIFEELPADGNKYIVKISTTGAEFFPADEYWGLGVYDTAKKLRERFGKHTAVSCIGQTGENKLFAAGIANTDHDGIPSRFSGRGGLGAVMGSKGIKALVIDDSGATVLQPADEKAFSEALKEYAKLLNESPGVRTYKTYGTAAMARNTNGVGALPTRNFSTGKFEGIEKISGEAVHDTIVSRKGDPSHACMPGCMIRCSNVYNDENAQPIVSPLEYETIALMGSNLDIDNLDAIARLNYITNDYGLDTIEAGAALGVAMAANVVSFGDIDGGINLVHEMGKATILGRVLGMGASIAGKVLGVSHVPVAKGQAMPGYEPRGMKGLGVTYATSPMGADHTAGSTARANVDQNSPVGQAEISKKMQYTAPVYDYLGLCLFTSAALGTQPELTVRMLNAQLGTSFSKDEVFEVTANVVRWEREFNKRAGLTHADDRLPESFTETPNLAIGTVFDVSGEELDGVHEMS